MHFEQTSNDNALDDEDLVQKLNSRPQRADNIAMIQDTVAIPQMVYNAVVVEKPSAEPSKGEGTVAKRQKIPFWRRCVGFIAAGKRN